MLGWERLRWRRRAELERCRCAGCRSGGRRRCRRGRLSGGRRCRDPGLGRREAGGRGFGASWMVSVLCVLTGRRGEAGEVRRDEVAVPSAARVLRGT